MYIEDTKNFIEQLKAKLEAELAATDYPELKKALETRIASLEMMLSGLEDGTDQTNKLADATDNWMKKFQD